MKKRRAGILLYEGKIIPNSKSLNEEKLVKKDIAFKFKL